MLKKSSLIFYYTFLFLNVVWHTISANFTYINYPKLLYSTAKFGDKSYILNELDSLTNELNKGWVLKADEEITIIFYILVDKKITSLDEIGKSHVFFTKNPASCRDFNSHEFEIKFSKELSKIHHPSNQTNRQKKIRQSVKNTTTNEIETTLLVGEADIKLKHSSDKYYTCLSFSKVNENEPKKKIIEKYSHQGIGNVYGQFITKKELLPIYLVIVFYIVLMFFSALFSGLNLGLMSLDLTELNILKKIGTYKEKKYASKIFPLRKRGNLLLCTILIGNVLVNSTSTLILGNYLEGLFAAVGSTMLIVIFGEIIPQAICSRHGLAVGTYTRFITYFMVYATFIVSYPLSKILDFFLGKEIASTYNRDLVRELMTQAKDGKGIEEKEFKILTGALDFKDKVIKDIMVPLNDVFSLDINSILDFEAFKLILHQGYSRIPVYEGSKECLVGMILIQDLLLSDPADKVPLKAVIEYYKHKVLKCKLEDKLTFMFDKFRKGYSHMAFVYNNDVDLETQDNAVADAVGICTFENIIEELVQSDIKDEADTKRERRKKKTRELLKGKLVKCNVSSENLNIFIEEDHSNRPLISPQVKKALLCFLSSTVRPFTKQFISPKVLEALLAKPDYTIEKRNLSGNDEYLYEFGAESDYFITILDGNATLQVGSEGYQINAGLFSYYGVDALVNEEENDPLECIGNDGNRKPYKPEFSLKVDNHCVCWKISRKDWKDAVKKTIMEQMVQSKQVNKKESKIIEINDSINENV